MANGTINVSGRLILPDGTSPDVYQMHFTLSQSDPDLVLNALVLQNTIKVNSDINGDISVDLWPNDAGLSGTHYKLVAVVNYRAIELQPMQLAEGADVRLEDVMSVEIADVPVVDFKASQYAAHAELAKTAAETAAASAAADQAQAGLDAEATAADRVQTGQDAAATAADRLQTGQDAAATAADKNTTNANALATGADRVQTGQDALAAEAAKDEAETASAAATSLVGTIDETLLTIATTFTNSQTRYVQKHAFS